MYDCLLINPRSIYYSNDQKSAAYLYAGLLSIGSFLDSKGWKVSILDMVVENNPIEALKKCINADPERVSLIGITVMTSQIPHAMQLSQYIRQEYPHISIIWGGVHPSLFPESILKEGMADFVCIGEGEYTTFELLNALKNKQTICTIKGLCYIKEGKIIKTGQRPCYSLDELPYFNYDLIDYSRYKNRTVFRGEEILHVNFGTVLTGYGCPYRCTFCINSNKKLFAGKYRSRSAKRIVDEIEYLIRKYSVNYFDFSDENFFINRANVETFISEVTRRNLVFFWYTNMRADAFQRKIVDSQMLTRLREIGCFRLAIGAESGSQSILDKLKKDISVEQIYQSAEYITKSGIGVTYSFMMGIPGETQADILSTLKTIRWLKSYSSKISIIGPQVFRPYPGGELYEECISKYNYHEPKHLKDWSNSIDILTGFDTIDKLPWIQNKDFIKRISFYIDLSNINIKALKVNFIKKIILKLLKMISNLRLRYQVWFFNIEMDLVILFKKIRFNY